VVRAYLDASGKREDPVVVVAGFLGWPASFDWFEQEWRSFLTEYALDHFHATDFWARKSRPYRDWTEATWLKARGDICKILSDRRGPSMGVVVAADVTVFQEWRGSLKDYYPSDPYYFCLDRVLNTLFYSTGPNDTGITIYCDQEKEHERLGADIAKWHEARLAQNPSLATNPLSGPRPVSFCYGPNRELVPLQLADILANDIFRSARDSIRSQPAAVPTDQPSQQGIWVRENQGLVDQYFTKCLKSVGPDRVVIYFCNHVALFSALRMT
jgi:hypothetical protein